MLNSSSTTGAVLDAIQFGMIIVGADRRVAAVNRTALAMMGYTSEDEIVGGVCHGVICPAEQGRCPILDLGQKVDLSEKFLLDRDGRRIPILKTVSRLVLDGREMLLETFVDITRQKEAERQAETARTFLQSVVDGVPEPVMVFEEDYTVTLMNRAAREFSLCGDRAAEGLKCHQVTHHSDVPCSTVSGHPCPLAEIKRTGRLVTVTHEHFKPGEGGRVVEVMATPLGGGEGGPLTIIETTRDITERVMLERQRADLFEMVTHDLKSPLSVILGYSELLLDDMSHGMSEDAVAMVAGIKRSGGKLLGMVEDYMAVSRLESGRTMLSAAPEDVGELVEETAREFMAAAHNKGLALVMEPASGSLRAVVDRNLVHRAVSNLLMNAVNYTLAGGVITVCVSREAGGSSGWAVVSVADTGPGIPAAEHTRVFEKYYRSSSSAGVKGSGIGLAIVKAVAEAHGGRVELTSEPGRGSEFRLCLPAG
ncbi:MAG: PAS domain-containing protein [Nitrospirae bacterium]|nr:PAS domain-containing protein [Nitrospirota bacterium]